MRATTTYTRSAADNAALIAQPIERDELRRTCGIDRDSEQEILAETLGALAEAQVLQPAGVTRRELGDYAPAVALELLQAALARLRLTGLACRIGIAWRLTAAGRHACLTTDMTEIDLTETHTMTTAAAPRTLSAADATEITEAFSRLVESSPALAAEINDTFRRTWARLDRAVALGVVDLDARQAAAVDCMTEGIAARLADAVTGA